MSLLLILLIIAFLALGGFGFAVHALWWGLIIVAVLIAVAYLAGSRGSGPPL